MKDIFRTVLVPHDFSKHADRALSAAADLDPAPKKLIVLHVANHYGNPAVQRRVVEEARRQLARAVSRTLGRRREPRVEQRVVTGDPFREIARAARRADSILMCTAGRTGLSHLVIGSVAEKVVRHAPRPVLSFRPGVAVAKRLFSSVVVPHDFSRYATRALALAGRLAGPAGRLAVLHVAADLPEGVNRIAGDRFFAAEKQRLDRLVAKAVPARGRPAVQCRVESGDPYRHIVQAARKGDVIVMCTAGRTGLRRLVIGSVAEKVVRHAAVPVLTFRPAVAVGRSARPHRAAPSFARARAARRSRRGPDQRRRSCP